MQISTHTQGQNTGSHIIKNDVSFAVLEMTVRPRISHTPTTVAHTLVYTEALMAGCGQLSKDAFIDALALLGAHIRVSVHNDAIHISVRSRNEHLKKVLTLLTLLIEKPTFAQNELTRIKTHIKQALILAKEDARPRARDSFVNALIPKDDVRYTFPIDTIIKEVTLVSKNELRALHTQVIGSAIEYTCGGTDEACRTIARTIQKLNHTSSPSNVTTPALIMPRISTPYVTCLDIPHKQNIEFSIGGNLSVTSTDPSYPALIFGLSVLGIRGSFSGRLMNTVREKEGLTYMIYAGTEEITTLQEGFWRIGTFFSPKDTQQGITSTIREIRTILEKGITTDELTRFKAILKTRFILVNDSLIKKVDEVHGYTTAGMSHSDFQTIQTNIQSLTRTEVNKALQKYVSLDALVISGAGPTKRIERDITRIVESH